MNSANGTWLFVVPWELHFAGGVNQVVLNLARELQARGSVQPVIAVNRWGQRRVEEFEFAGLRLIRLWAPTPWTEMHPVRGALRYILALPLVLLRLARVLRQYDVSVVNVHYPNLSALNWMLLRRLGLFRGKLLISLHGLDIRNVAIETRLVRYLWQALVLGADGVVACSDGLRDEAAAILNVEPDRVVTIHNGVNIEDIDKERAAAAMSPATRVLPPRYIANVATYEFKKGQDLLIDAFHAIAAEDPDLHLVIVGRNGAAFPTLQAQIVSLNLTNQVHLFRNCSHGETIAVLAAAEFFVLPSRNEGFALVLLEASALGKPIIATNVCGVTELLDDGVTGRIVTTEDVGALTSALREFIREPDMAADMGRLARKRVDLRFGWREKCAEYLRLSDLA